MTVIPLKKIRIVKPKLTEEEIAAREAGRKQRIETKLYADQIKRNRVKAKFYETETKAFEAEEKARKTAAKYGFEFKSYEEKMKEYLPKNKEPIFTRAHYLLLVKCLHPESRKDATEQELNDAVAILNAQKDRLTK